MSMSEARWSRTSAYLGEVFGREDPHLRQLILDAREAGLPEISVSAEVGRLLSLLLQTTRGLRALELGTLGGYSSTWIARALAPGGKLTTIELSPAHAAFARAHFAKGGLSERVEVVEGAALAVLEPLQLVGLSADEYEATKSWDTMKLLGVLAERDPALLTDLARSSALSDPDIRRRVEAGTAQDGSSMELFFATRGSLDTKGPAPILGVAANGLDDLKRLIRGRLAFERPAMICWPEGTVKLQAADKTYLLDRKEGFALDPADRAAILELPVARGDYPLPSGRLILRVIPVEILDGARKKVLRTIG